MRDSVHLDLDGAWPDDVLNLRRMDLRHWGPRLRFLTTLREIEAFYAQVSDSLPAFKLYGSGDLHHLTALWIRAIERDISIVSFDNHPDWDCRPPRWACGAWINRALELPNVSRVAVWGCGNFELRFPWRLTGNGRAVREGKLEIYPWRERHSPATLRRYNAIGRDDWRDRFEAFAREWAGGDIYVTVDMDCLAAEEAATNWENGLFLAEDVAWAIGVLADAGRLAGGDVCGAWSAPRYARRFQRLAGWWEHRGAPRVNPHEARIRNMSALAKIWTALHNGR